MFSEHKDYREMRTAAGIYKEFLRFQSPDCCRSNMPERIKLLGAFFDLLVAAPSSRHCSTSTEFISRVNFRITRIIQRLARTKRNDIQWKCATAFKFKCTWKKKLLFVSSASKTIKTRIRRRHENLRWLASLLLAATCWFSVSFLLLHIFIIILTNDDDSFISPCQFARKHGNTRKK